MLDGARALFIGDGYAATTMDRIAEHAGVAVRNPYYTFRTKGQLLCEVVEVTAAGDEDPPPVQQRAWVQDMLTATSGQRALALAVEHGADIFVRAAPLWPVVTRPLPTPGSPSTGAALPRPGAPARRGWLPGLASWACSVTVSTPNRHRPHGRSLRPRHVPQPGQSGRLERSGVQGLAAATLAQQLLQRPKLARSAYSDLSYAP